jgi:hypothetical protein
MLKEKYHQKLYTHNHLNVPNSLLILLQTVIGSLSNCSIKQQLQQQQLRRLQKRSEGVFQHWPSLVETYETISYAKKNVTAL